MIRHEYTIKQMVLCGVFFFKCDVVVIPMTRTAVLECST